MKAPAWVALRHGDWALALIGSALLSVCACSGRRSDASPTRALPLRAVAGANASASMVVEIDQDAGVFLSASENVAVPAVNPARANPISRVEKDAFGGNMVRLDGRFSGVLRAELSGGELRAECDGPSAAGAPGAR